jgi:thiamine biosynthesis lipoprotein
VKNRLARWGLPVLALVLVVAYAAGRRPEPPRSETRFLMDTLVTVTLWGVAEQPAQRAWDAAFAALEDVDREMARIPGTPLWRLDQAGHGEVSSGLGEVLQASLEWAARSGGAFDPTVAPLLDLWNVLEGPHPPPSPEAIQEGLDRVGWRRVRWNPATRTVDLGGTAVDLGGIAKGWAIDRAVAALGEAGARDFIVDAGGDLYVSGSKGGAPWRVGIQHPRDPDAFLRKVNPAEGALVTSGDYERAYEWEGVRYHHILDPRTGYPARGCQSVSVWATTATRADAMATAVFVLGPEKGLALLESEPGAEGLVVDAAGRVQETSGFARVAPEVPGT